MHQLGNISKHDTKQHYSKLGPAQRSSCECTYCLDAQYYIEDLRAWVFKNKRCWDIELREQKKWIDLKKDRHSNTEQFKRRNKEYGEEKELYKNWMQDRWETVDGQQVPIVHAIDESD